MKIGSTLFLLLCVMTLSCGLGPYVDRLDDKTLQFEDKGRREVRKGVYLQRFYITGGADNWRTIDEAVYFLCDSLGNPLAGASANYRQGKTNQVTVTVMDDPTLSISAANIMELKQKVDALASDEEYQTYMRLRQKFGKAEAE